MHFKINNKTNTISQFHIEQWDKESLGEAYCKKIESYVGSTEETFISFAVKERLFLKIRILFSSIDEGAGVTYFWNIPSIYGENHNSKLRFLTQAKNSETWLSYARFLWRVSGSDTNDVVYPAYISYDVNLAYVFEPNCKTRDFVISATPEEIEKLSSEFSIARNGENCCYVAHMKDGGSMEVGRFPFHELAYTAVEKDGGLKVFYGESAKHILEEDFSQYLAFQVTNPENEKELAERDEIIQKIRLVAGIKS